MRGGRQQRGGEGMTVGAEGYGAEVERADVHQRGGLEWPLGEDKGRRLEGLTPIHAVAWDRLLR